MLSLSCKEKIVIQVFSFSWHLYQASYFKITALNEHVLEKKKQMHTSMWSRKRSARNLVSSLKNGEPAHTIYKIQNQ